MKRVLTILIAVAALGSAGWFGIYALGGSEPLASVPIPIKAAENLPDTPAEWRGRIDYRALDRQLTAISQRPEMAGLAVEGVEDGQLRFVRRSEESRVGVECVRVCRYRGSVYPYKKNKYLISDIRATK